MRFRRSGRLPDDVRERLRLQPGEHVLATGRSAGDGWVVATGRALHSPDVRVEWTDVAHAQWLDEEQVLAVDPVPGRGAPARLRLTEPGRVPETVHERVMASIVLSRRVALPGGGARVVARRGEGSDDTIWQVLPDPGTDLDAPEVQAVVEALLVQLQGELS